MVSATEDNSLLKQRMLPERMTEQDLQNQLGDYEMAC